MWIDRKIRADIERALATRPALVLTGARQTGKSSLLRQMLPQVEYVTLDRVALAMEAEECPERFLDRFPGPVILDEVQHAPALFREIKIRIDANRDVNGRWILTGSQKFELMNQVGESLAGRLRVLHLETLSAAEIRGYGELPVADIVWRGGYPETWAKPELEPPEFFEDYISTYLERDLSHIVQVANLRDFRRFVQVCATRSGQLLNAAELGRDVGVAADTVKRWLAALQAGGLVYLLPPYFANIGKRLTKAPKLYFADPGLLCHLLNIHTPEQWHQHPAKGALWENFVLSELIKDSSLVPGRSLFFYRDQNAVEIDFVIDCGSELILIEAKAAEQVNPGKLNFHKVVPLFEPRLPVRCAVACQTNEKQHVHTRSFVIYNPVYCSVPW